MKKVFSCLLLASLLFTLVSCNKDYENPKEFTVTFETGESGNTVVSQKVKDGGKVIEPEVPILGGYTFAGWYKEVEGKNEWNFDVDFVTADITLFAGWIMDDNDDEIGIDKDDEIDDNAYLTDLNALIEGWEISKHEFGFSAMQTVGIYFVNPETGYLVQDHGERYKTTDSGKTWEKQNSGIYSRLGAAFFLDENIGFASLNRGYDSNDSLFLKTVNGGETWTKTYIGEYVAMPCLRFFDEKNGLAVIITDYSKPNSKTHFIAKTSDGGDHWEFLDLNNHYATSKFYYFDDTVFVIGNDQEIFKSKDQGNTWETIRTPQKVMDLYFYNENIGYMIGGVNVYKTIDGGVSWEIVDFPVSSFHFLHFYNEDEGFMIEQVYEYHGFGFNPYSYVGSVGYHTHDGGKNWTKSELIKAHIWWAIYFVQPDLGYGINGRDFFTIKRSIMK
ncbi:MAG: InlB B-repeat-containing protein [Bacteroidales bacterium]|nr:InlB B-repeat-containing protein [Bacteroidales bacterium]